MSGEESVWAPVPGYEEAYEVSTSGDVRNLRTGKVVKPFKGDSGSHRKVSLSVSGHVRSVYVHRLVLAAFVGAAPNGMEALHNDGDPANNRIDNLRWGSRSENVLDSVRHGTYRNVNAEKTTCLRGHVYNESNTYRDPSGRRRCKSCRRAS